MYTTNNWSCQLFWRIIKILNRFNLFELRPVVNSVVAMRCKQTSCLDIDFVILCKYAAKVTFQVIGIAAIL